MPLKKMDSKKLAIYKKSLLKLMEQTQGDIKQMSSANSVSDKDASAEISGHGLHLADVATDMYDREFSLGLASNDRELLSKVRLALKRIEEKAYGVCTQCRKPISMARLNAIPYTETCLKCQEKLESEK